MKPAYRKVFILLLAVAAGILIFKILNPRHIIPKFNHNFTKEEIESLDHAASSGDKDAAAKLWHYYSWVEEKSKADHYFKIIEGKKAQPQASREPSQR